MVLTVFDPPAAQEQPTAMMSTVADALVVLRARAFAAEVVRCGLRLDR